MSFGRPGGFSSIIQPTPPDRGSFPLDHEGECKAFMTTYLQCLKAHGNSNTECRHLAKEYLNCRMDKGLMVRDDWQNLGLQNTTKPDNSPPHSSPSNSSGSTTGGRGGTGG
ncbi:hypothetical protein BT69DRAFT_1258051 [Atractiella rhizophila]|nr:hypothetical protein BT69DRAFT_1258051 [Atractiella rhizophila]